MEEATRPLAFGVSLVPETAQKGLNLELTRAAETEGLDLAGVQDHPYVGRFLDTWSMTGFLLARTQRLRFFTDVASLPLRQPAVMAKAAASLDLLSGGRFELGIGAGAYWGGVASLGGPSRRPAEAREALEEAIAVIRAMWSGERNIRLKGRYYAVRGADGGPPPAHQIGIWVGAQGPQALRLTGRIADGWAASIPSYVPYERWPASMRYVDDGALEAGREPGEVFRICNIPGTITGGPHGPHPIRGAEPLRGPSSFWVEVLAGWALDLGFDGFVLWPEVPSASQVERFACEVAPAVREAARRPATIRAGRCEAEVPVPQHDGGR